MDHGIAHPCFASQPGHVPSTGAVKFINHNHLVAEESPDAVIINGDAGIASAVILDPGDIIIQGVKSAQPTLLTAIPQAGDPGIRINQLQLIDMEREKIRQVCWRWISQARVEFNPLPFRWVVAGCTDHQASRFIRLENFGQIVDQCRGRRITIGKIHRETIRQADFCCPFRYPIGIAARVIADDHGPASTVFPADKIRHINIVEVITNRLDNLLGPALGEIRIPPTAHPRGAKAQVFSVVDHTQ